MEAVLDILAREARCSLEEIATRLDLTTEEVAQAIGDMEQQGVIVGYKALIDWEKVGSKKVYALIEVRAEPEPKHGFHAVAEYIARYPEVHSVYLVSGAFDLCVVVEGEDFRDIASFVAEELAPHPQVVSTATHFVLKNYKLDGQMLVGERPARRLAVSP
ncbi:MAG: Lrp/AsnC family transcriptional regulator [Armatimonadota bacterium]